MAHVFLEDMSLVNGWLPLYFNVLVAHDDDDGLEWNLILKFLLGLGNVWPWVFLFSRSIYLQ